MKLKAVLFFLLFLYLSTKLVVAQHFESPSYVIDWGNFNITSGKKTSANYSLTDTVGQNAPGQYDSAGFVLKSGFQYIYDTFNQFSFFIDDLSIELGSLTPGVGSTDTNIITISTPSGHGYQIMAHQDHPLWIDSQSFIPDTTCDSGNCTESVSDVWQTNSAYGFGFNAIGIGASGETTGLGTDTIFPDNTYFRQFADYYQNEPNQIIMTENSPVKDHSARITYKALISTTQTTGQYQNTIIFTAVPKY